MEDVSAEGLYEVGAGTYDIDPARSTVHYTGKHMFGLGTVHAEFGLTSGLIRVDDPLTGSSVHAVIDAGSFSSDSDRRDVDITRNFLEVDTHPEITFASTGVSRNGDRILVDGTVTAHAGTAPVQVVVHAIRAEGDGVRIHARAAHLDRLAFGITRGRGMVGRFLDLDLDVLAVRR